MSWNIYLHTSRLIFETCYAYWYNFSDSSIHQDKRRYKIIVLAVDECTEGTASCDINAVCTDTATAYSCTCKTGYEGNGVVNVNDPVGCVLMPCPTGQTRDPTTGLCECTVNCGTGATCDEDLSDNSYSCTCDSGYEPDTLLTTATDYYCTGKAAPTLLKRYESYRINHIH